MERDGPECFYIKTKLLIKGKGVDEQRLPLNSSAQHNQNLSI